MVHGLNDNALSRFLLHKLVHTELNILAFLYVSKVLLETGVVRVDGLKQVKESSDNLKVAFLEGLIKLKQLSRVTYLLVELVLLFEIVEGEEYLEELFLLWVS